VPKCSGCGTTKSREYTREGSKTYCAKCINFCYDKECDGTCERYHSPSQKASLAAIGRAGPH